MSDCVDPLLELSLLSLRAISGCKRSDGSDTLVCKQWVGDDMGNSPKINIQFFRDICILLYYIL